MMRSNHSEIGAAWIVALSLVALMAVHAFLPQTPPRLARGVADAATVRTGATFKESPVNVPDTDVPLMEFGDPFGPEFGDRVIATPHGPSGSDLGAPTGPARS